MAGELSKKIGENGEEIALSFFKRIGWDPIQTAINIPCSNPQEHSKKNAKRPRSLHGLDLLFSYLCPLLPGVRRNVLISMKNSDFERTSNRTTLVKDDLRQLDILLDCFATSEKRAELQSTGGFHSIQDSGILIRINRDLDTDRSYITEKDAIIGRQSNSNPLCFVENQRFDFVDSCMNYIDFELKGRRNTFNIPRNSLNLSGEVRLNEANLLPLQSLVSGPIIIRSENDSEKSLIIFSDDSFSEIHLKRMIGLGLQCSNGWASEVRVVIKGFDRTKSEMLESMRSQIHDKHFARSVRCDSFEIRSRLK